MSTPPIVVLTGPAAAGKNAVADALVALAPALAVVDIDTVRWMVRKPHVAPWGGDEGHRQLEIGVRNGCHLARSFVAAGFPTLILDVVMGRTAKLYRGLLADVGVRIVQLLPAWDVAKARFVERARTLPSASVEEARVAYDWQVALDDVDERIDSTTLSVHEVALRIAPLLTIGGR